MTEWVLIVIMWGWSGKGVAVHYERFPTESGCNTIGEATAAMGHHDAHVKFTCRQIIKASQ